MRKIIAVDFDGTITKSNNFPNKPKKEDIMEHCVEVLSTLHELGYIIILWTCRYGEYLEDAVEYCREMGIPIDYVNESCKEALELYGECSGKVGADYYIDDKNIGGFIGWAKVGNIIMLDNLQDKLRARVEKRGIS